MFETGFKHVWNVFQKAMFETFFKHVWIGFKKLMFKTLIFKHVWNVFFLEIIVCQNGLLVIINALCTLLPEVFLDISPHERAAKEPQSGEKTSRKATLTRTCSQLREKKKIQETWISGTRVYCVTLQWNEVFHSLIHVWNAFWNIRDCLIAFWVFDELFCMKLGNNRQLPLCMPSLCRRL